MSARSGLRRCAAVGLGALLSCGALVGAGSVPASAAGLGASGFEVTGLEVSSLGVARAFHVASPEGDDAALADRVICRDVVCVPVPSCPGPRPWPWTHLFPKPPTSPGPDMRPVRSVTGTTGTPAAGGSATGEPSDIERLPCPPPPCPRPPIAKLPDDRYLPCPKPVPEPFPRPWPGPREPLGVGG